MMTVTICIVCLACVFVQLAVCNFVRYDNYSCVDYGNSSGSLVPTVMDCQLLAFTESSANGVMYNWVSSNCIVLSSANNQMVMKLRANNGWSTFVTDVSDEFKVVYKADAAQGASSNVYVLYDAITNSGNAKFTSDWNATTQSFRRTTSCNCTYRNELFDYWSSVQVSWFIQFLLRNRKIECYDAWCLFSGVLGSLTLLRVANNRNATCFQRFELQQHKLVKQVTLDAVLSICPTVLANKHIHRRWHQTIPNLQLVSWTLSVIFLANRFIKSLNN